MGKVRASQDKVPKVKAGSSKAKKTTFDVDETNDDVETAIEKGGDEPITTKKSKAKRAKERTGGEEAPEEVRADTEEVRKLREWHEQLVLGKDAKKKKSSSSSSDIKRAAGRLAVGSGRGYDHEIDPSILEGVGEEGDDEEEEEDEDDEVDEQAPGRIDKHSRKSRRIDNVLVTVLDEARLSDPFRTHQPQKAAELFLGETLQRAEGRVRYARYAAGKRGGPAIKFTLV